MKYHQSVLLKEVVEYLKPKKGDIVLDATFGFGGHSQVFSKMIGREGKVVAFEQDRRIYQKVSKGLPDNIVLINDNFTSYRKHLDRLRINLVDKVLFDLGVSSWHFDYSGLGFSFKNDEPLDMRIDSKNKISARDIINSYSQTELADLFFYLSDEHRSRKIASEIINFRAKKKIDTTGELVGIVERVKGKNTRGINAATKVFQALRIEVNHELSNLKKTLEAIMQDVSSGGRVAVISFHSKEDRIVKNTFKKCRDKSEVQSLTKKPIVPSRNEINSNPRSRSAKMRVVEKK